VNERNRYIRGLISWLGFKQTGVEFSRDKRFAGETKYPLKKMIKFAFDAITSFSYKPLKLASYTGMLLSCASFIYLLIVIYQKLFTGGTVRGLTSILAVNLFFNGIVLIILGKYLGFGFLEYIYGALLGGGVISLIVILTKGMGWGDAEICFLCGLFLGLRLTMLMLFLSFVLGGVTGVILILLKKKSSKDYIPFGPFIALAAVFCVYFGEPLLGWYVSMF
jgi:prepilin signal peptidase PulO-like enzyme (type II secretory pathway)